MAPARSRLTDYAPSDKPLELTQGDIDIFLLLQEFPYLPLPYIGELLGHKKRMEPGKDGRTQVRYEHLRHRLARLRKDHGYLKCPVESFRNPNYRYRPAVYALTLKAKNELRTRGLYRQSFKLGNDFAHDFGSCLIPASFKLGVKANPKLRYITGREILDHEGCPPTTRELPEPFAVPVTYKHRQAAIDTHKEHDWEPFGVAFKLDNGKERKIQFPGHEFDRSTEPLDTDDAKRTSMTRHLLAILALLDRGYEKHFGTGRFYVPIVTIGEVRMRSIMRLLLKLTDGKGSQRILFKYVDDFSSFAAFPPATGHMLTEPWERAGFEPFNILAELAPKEKKATE